MNMSKENVAAVMAASTAEAELAGDSGNSCSSVTTKTRGSSAPESTLVVWRWGVHADIDLR